MEKGEPVTITRERNWQQAYLCDFTGQATQNLRTGGNGSKTIDGKTWTWGNDANSTSADVTNGTGIVLVTNTTVSDFMNSANSAPKLSVLVQTLFPDYDILNHMIRISARITNLSGMTTLAHVAKFGLEDATTPLTQNFSAVKGFNTETNQYFTHSTQSSVTTQSDFSAGTDEDVFSIIFEAPLKFSIFSSIYPSGIYFPPAALRHSESQLNSTAGLMRLPQQPKIFFSFRNTPSGVVSSYTITHLKLEYYNRNPLD